MILKVTLKYMVRVSANIYRYCFSDVNTVMKLCIMIFACLLCLGEAKKDKR